MRGRKLREAKTAKNLTIVHTRNYIMTVVNSRQQTLDLTAALRIKTKSDQYYTWEIV